MKPIGAKIMIAAFASGLGMAGCAGPSTPLGALWAVHPSQVTRELAEVPDQPSPTLGAPGVTIDFRPERQVLHGPKPLVVRIADTQGLAEKPRIRVRYDGLDVTRTFLSQARRTVRAGDREMWIRIPVIRLSPHIDHRIEVRYYTTAGKSAWAYYQAPICRMMDNRLVKTTDSFTPEVALLTLIESLSIEAQVNPSLETALIAQESSFNPRTVSWAKAIGLTQVTPIAENAISDRISDYQSWPRYSGIGRYPASVIKMMVMAGKINASNDWKLNKELSIRGGLAYLILLQKRWSTPEMKARFNEVERTKLVLASYNSGVTRVVSAVGRYGKNWLSAPELREARKYVNRIFSFCDYFSQDIQSNEVGHEKQT